MKLTDEQIEAAAEAAYENRAKHLHSNCVWKKLSSEIRSYWRADVAIAAPFLQLPWDMPTAAEIVMVDTHGSYRVNTGEGYIHFASGISSGLARFVFHRNGLLIPKHVDPRQEIIANALNKYNTPYVDAAKMAEAILAALDVYAKE